VTGSPRHEAVFLSNGLQLIFGERAEILIIERLPELRDEQGEAPTIDQLFGLGERGTC